MTTTATEIVTALEVLAALEKSTTALLASELADRLELPWETVLSALKGAQQAGRVTVEPPRRIGYQATRFIATKRNSL